MTEPVEEVAEESKTASVDDRVRRVVGVCELAAVGERSKVA